MKIPNPYPQSPFPSLQCQFPIQIPNQLGNKGYDFFEKDKDKDNILVDNILGIILEDSLSFKGYG